MNESALLREYFAPCVRSSGTMLDVGAFDGDTARPYLDMDWRVFAFEPDPGNRRKLVELARQYPNLTVDSRAVSDRAQNGVPFFTSPVSVGISGLSRFHESHVESGRVDTVTLDAFCVEQKITEIHYLKIDTEGYDLPVLRGVPWQRVKPQVVLCEFEDRKTVPLGYTFQDMAQFLQDQGYELVVSEWYPVVKYNTQHRWRRFTAYPCRLEDPADWGNIMAFRDGVDWGRLMTAQESWIPHALLEAEARVRALRESLSWRMTAPLRWMGSAMKKGLKPET